jgi:hypothetical protein
MLFQTIRQTALRVVVDSLVPALSARRWTVLRTDQGMFIIGYVIGRRAVKWIGVVMVFVLQADGGFRPMLVPVDGSVPEVDEESARTSFVEANQRGYIPKGHVFEPSPVLSSLCAVCAKEPLHHDRERKLIMLQQFLSTLEVEVTWTQGTCGFSEITVRNKPVQTPRLNPMPGTEEYENREVRVVERPPPRVAFRPVTPEERAMIDQHFAEFSL